MYNPTVLFTYGIILIVGVRAVHNGMSNKYFISPERTNFYAARDHCTANNADLATFETNADLDVVSNYLIQHGYNSEVNDLFWVSYWNLGRPHGMFYSIATGQLMTSSGWVPGQPDNAGGNEHCVHIWKRNGRYGMNDNNCHENLRAICQRRTYSFPQKCCQYRNRTSTC